MFGSEEFREGILQAGGDHLWQHKERFQDAWTYRNSNGLNFTWEWTDLTYSCKLGVQPNSQKHEEEQSGPQRGNRKLRQSVWICNECQAKSCTKTEKHYITWRPSKCFLIISASTMSDLPSPLLQQAFCRCAPCDPRLKISQSLQTHWYLGKYETNNKIDQHINNSSKLSLYTYVAVAVHLPALVSVTTNESLNMLLWKLL